ncbi:MAG TPA: hypothetical protein VLT45_24570 [Kofleriaceae bacterium]|nr:hypothetical protein [Kofleriaceae bacterium]
MKSGLLQRRLRRVDRLTSRSSNSPAAMARVSGTRSPVSTSIEIWGGARSVNAYARMPWRTDTLR